MLIKDKESYRLNIIGAAVIWLAIPFIVAKVDSFLITIIIMLCIGGISVIILNKSSGLEIDFRKKRYRNYANSFGNLSGDWKVLGNFSVIVYLGRSGQKSASGTLMTGSVKVKKEYYELYLMDENHLKRLFIFTTNRVTELERMIDKLKKGLDLKEEKYNPVTRRNSNRR